MIVDDRYLECFSVSEKELNPPDVAASMKRSFTRARFCMPGGSFFDRNWRKIFSLSASPKDWII